MSKSLVVIHTPDNPYQLDVAEGGRYFAIPGLATLMDALRIRLSELRNLACSTVGVEVEGVLQAPVAAEIKICGAGVTYLRSRDARRTFGTGVDLGSIICNDVTARTIEGENPLNIHNISLGI